MYKILVTSTFYNSGQGGGAGIQMLVIDFSSAEEAENAVIAINASNKLPGNLVHYAFKLF